MVSKRFYVKAGEAILPLGLLRHGLIATRAAPPCPLGQLVGFSPPRFSGPSRRGEGSPAEGTRSRPAAEPSAMPMDLTCLSSRLLCKACCAQRPLGREVAAGRRAATPLLATERKSQRWTCCGH